MINKNSYQISGIVIIRVGKLVPAQFQSGGGHGASSHQYGVALIVIGYPGRSAQTGAGLLTARP